MLNLLILAFSLATPSATAASCDTYVRTAERARGAALSKAFTDLARCDKALAETSFTKFMTSADDSESLVALSLAAIDSDVWKPVWTMIGHISSYEARNEVSAAVGAACTEHDRVVPFLQGAYFGLRDLDFSQWDDALMSCESPALVSWMEDQVSRPPEKLYDEKFNAVLDAYARREGKDALSALTKGAVAAAKAGPYETILLAMDTSVAPSLGETMPADNQAALEAALSEVARKVDPDKARAVADRLASAGSEQAAAKLLPAIYPDRVQSDGGFLYGGATVELADCKGVKTAVVHHAGIREPGKRWNVLADASAELAAAKPRLTKCTAEGEPSVLVSPEPVGSAKDVEAWASGLAAQWAEKGYEASTRAEKDIILN